MIPKPSETDDLHAYEPVPFGRRGVIVPLFAIPIVVAMQAALLAGSLGDLPVVVIIWMALMYLVAMPLGVFLVLFRFPYRFEFDGRVLRWIAVLRSGEVPIERISAVRKRLLSNGLRIETVDGTRVPSLLPLRGISDFTEVLRRERPSITIKLGMQVKWMETLYPIRSRYRIERQGS